MIHERNGRTDGQTPHHSIYRAYAYASRGKKLGAADLTRHHPSVNFGPPKVWESTRARMLKLKTQLDIVKYSLWVQKFLR